MLTFLYCLIQPPQIKQLNISTVKLWWVGDIIKLNAFDSKNKPCLLQFSLEKLQRVVKNKCEKKLKSALKYEMNIIAELK